MPLIKDSEEFAQAKHLAKTMTLEQLEEDFAALEQTYFDLWFTALKQEAIKLRKFSPTNDVLLLNPQEFELMFEDLKTNILNLMIIENYSFVAARRSVLGKIFSAHESYIYGITYRTTSKISEDMNEIWMANLTTHDARGMIYTTEYGFNSGWLKLGVVELCVIINEDQNIRALVLSFWHAGEYTRKLITLDQALKNTYPALNICEICVLNNKDDITMFKMIMDFSRNHIEWLRTNECFFQFLKRQLTPYNAELDFYNKETIFADFHHATSGFHEKKWKQLYLSGNEADDPFKKVVALFNCLRHMRYSYLGYSEIDNLIIKTQSFIEHLRDKAVKIGEHNITSEEKAIAFYCIQKYKEAIAAEMKTMLTIRSNADEEIKWKHNFFIIKNLCKTLDNAFEPTYSSFSFFKQALDEDEHNYKDTKVKKAKNAKRCILF